jgi:hypothetical protein
MGLPHPHQISKFIGRRNTLKKRVLICSLVFVGLIWVAAMASLFYADRRAEFKGPESLFDLKGKSESEIELKYGNPINTGVWFDGVTPVQTYRISGNSRLRVAYVKGAAFSFYFFIPPEFQPSDPRDALGLCGIDLKVADAQTDKDGLFWHANLPDQSTAIVRLDKIGSRFASCEADLY